MGSSHGHLKECSTVPFPRTLPGSQFLSLEKLIFPQSQPGLNPSQSRGRSISPAKEPETKDLKQNEIEVLLKLGSRRSRGRCATRTHFFG